MADQTELRATFDSSAAQYQSARPEYPDQLFDELVMITGVAPANRLLEIGCGSGKATVPMARRGYPITALELGPRLAAEARRSLRQFPQATVINSAFEDWRPAADQRFDLIYAANAWHWLDRELRWERSATLLRPEGHLAVFGASHAIPHDFDPFFTEIQAVYEEIGEALGEWPPPPPDQLPDPTAEYEASGHFSVDAVRRYVWPLQYDAASYIELLQTFSNHIAMPPEHRERLFGAVRELLGRRPDGLLTRHWVSTLVIAHRR